MTAPKNNKKRGATPLNPGDPGFKTATQLRNERKRKKLKQDKLHQASSDLSSSTATAAEDPSLKYIADPTSAPIIQHAQQFFSHQHAEFPVQIGPLEGWRTVAKLAVRAQDGCLKIGLFVPGSHQLLEVPQCKAHHPRINDAVAVLQKKCRSLHIQSFDDKTGEGSLRHVAISIERKTGKQQLTLVWKGPDEQPQELQKLCDTLIRVSRNNNEQLALHSLWVHYNSSWKHANAIFARDGIWEKQFGDDGDAIVEILPISDTISVPLQFPPQVFRQANLDAFSKIVIKIREWLQQDQTTSTRPSTHKRRCLELYGGVGTIGLHLADLFETIVSSDENPFNKSCFENALRHMQFLADGIQVLPESENSSKTDISYHSKNASDMVQSGALHKADVVVVDPPRKGLDEDVLERLCCDTTPQSLVYVSCGFEAFTRDFAKLTRDGNWKLDHAQGHVLFPGSDAIETLAFFTRTV
jgi:tRNA/tmRNA/rRNA uracil-C5-methylase (TrmA/RlmC/RlmD family)